MSTIRRKYVQFYKNARITGLLWHIAFLIHNTLVSLKSSYRGISRAVIASREVDYSLDLDLYVRYCLTNTTLCL